MLAQLREKLQHLAKQTTQDPQVISYQTLRKTIGWLGIFLPFAMIVGAKVLSQCTTIQPSISHYYYTNMREIFVGTLCAVSLFLFSYKGLSKIDSYVSNLAGFFGLAIVFFPTNVLCTNDICYPCQQNVISLTRIPYHHNLHFIAAALFFFTLAMMSIFLFRLSDKPGNKQTVQKRKRNVIFLVCGIIMLASIITCGIYIQFFKEENSTVVLWLETVALVAFGISWLTKGEVIMEDK
jgi:hypothetical protein